MQYQKNKWHSISKGNKIDFIIDNEEGFDNVTVYIYKINNIFVKNCFR